MSGHSGEGKSTFMYIVSGIIPNVNYGRLSGEVFVGGENIKGKKLGYICRRVGVVLQNADEQIIQKIAEDEIASGCENLAFPPESIQKQIEIVCNLMKLDKKWTCRTLSGGQKQRLITASTLAMGQKIIILDEPLANLGAIVQYIDEKFGQKPKGSRAWYKKVGIVYQNPDYQLFMPTVRQEISFGAKSEEYAAEIAELFGVKHLWERHPQSLSEGQKRRVSIAAVAACEPEVLLLDEPTVGQDYDGYFEIREQRGTYL